ncbi:hypothetical protein MMC28_008127 [Mycoblastus sanguinarius]|nr:hypothetical protein [Mycoblastus sanguinarius]
MASPIAFRFLDLPLELRSRIYELLFFGSEEDDKPLHHVYYPYRRDIPYLRDPMTGKLVEAPEMAFTSIRQLHPNRHQLRRSRDPLTLTIFRTNHQVQVEAESTFYGMASFNLMVPWNLRGLAGNGNRARVYDNCHDPRRGVQSWEFLQKLPRRYRKLIRRVEHYCFAESTRCAYGPFRDVCRPSYTLFDWELFMTFLARECPALQSLKLWVWEDGCEAKSFVNASKDGAWIQAILQLKGLRHFDMPAIKSAETEYPAEHNRSGAKNLLPWLQKSLLQNFKVSNSISQEMWIQHPQGQPKFDLLKLPAAIRKRIFRYVLLPENKQIQPYIRPWWNSTLGNVLPLFLTCRLIHQEAENIFYEKGIFSVPVDCRQPLMLLDFFSKLEPRLRAKVRHLMVPKLAGWSTAIYLIRYTAEEMNLDNFVYVLDGLAVREANYCWLYRSARGFDKHWRHCFSLFKSVHLKVEGEVGLSPAIREYIEHDLRKEYLAAERRRRSLRSSSRAILQM